MSNQPTETATAAAAETALDEIHAVLDGVEWSADSLDSIAEILERTGREISEPTA